MTTWLNARMRFGGKQGFTLTELMIVVTVMGVLLAVGAPFYGRYMASWRLSGETSKMAMVMRAARSAAVNKNCDVIFVFDQDDGEYYFVEDTDGDGSAGAGEHVSGVQTLGKGVTIADFDMAQQWVTFSPRGSTADGGTITMQGKHEDQRVIKVFGGTGNISVD